MATITFVFDTAKVLGDALRQPGGLAIETSPNGCPCAPEGQPTPLRADVEGVACQCGRPVARWTGAPGVSELELVDQAT
jgi:hypothetical protein